MAHTVPGLIRGIELLQILTDHEAGSLEDMVRWSGYPRTSVHRLLSTLVALNIIEKSSVTRKYHPLKSLRPLSEETRLDFENLLAEQMEALGCKTGLTVEWYVETKEGAVLARRFQTPDLQVHVVARPGFLRTWKGELDAVAQVLRAFAPNGPNQWSGMWTYEEDGRKRPLKATDARRITQQTASNGIGVDPHFNSNGIRRIAAPVLSDHRLEGILALAMHYTPDWETRETTLRKTLTAAASRLQSASRAY
jgi:DNA-binding IclR family transcriptional regulator